MATVGQATDPQLEEFSGLSLNGESSGPEIDGNDRNEALELYENWGLPLSDLYRLAMQFYRGGWTRCRLLELDLTCHLKRHNQEKSPGTALQIRCIFVSWF